MFSSDEARGGRAARDTDGHATHRARGESDTERDTDSGMSVQEAETYCTEHKVAERLTAVLDNGPAKRGKRPRPVSLVVVCLSTLVEEYRTQ